MSAPPLRRREAEPGRSRTEAAPAGRRAEVATGADGSPDAAPRPAPWAGAALAAALASGALAWRLGSDPLAGPAAVAPLAAWAYALLARWGRARGARPLPAPVAGLTAAAWAALALAALGYRSAGLAVAAPALAAGFGAVALAVAGALAWSWRPLLGGRTGWSRPPVGFFFLPLVLYLALLPWSAGARAPDGDEPYYLLLAHSLATDLDADLADEYAGGAGRRFLARPLGPQPGDPVGPHGELYSRHNLLLPALLVPGYLVAGRWGALVLMAAAAALLAWLTLGLALRYRPDRPAAALGVYALLAFASPLVDYSHQVWVEVPAAVLVALALDGILARAGTGGGAAGGSAGGWWRIGRVALPILLLPLLKLRFFLLVVPLVLLAAWTERGNGRRTDLGRREVVGLGAAVAGLAALVLTFNLARYGNPLKNHRVTELDPSSYLPAAWAKGFLGFFWDAAFGLFGAAPLWLLVVPAVAWALASRPTGRSLGDSTGRSVGDSPRKPVGRPVGSPAGHVALVALPYLLVAAPRLEWYGGWAPPFRYGMAVLPLLALLLVPLFAAWSERPPARRHLVLVGLLGTWTALLALLWMAVPGWTYDFAHGRTHLADGLSAAVGADVARLLPSYVRPRIASWLWPPLSVLAVVALAWPVGAAVAAGSRLRRRRSLQAGAAAALALLAVVPAAATRLPTRVAELEDPWVIKRGGRAHPDTWTVARSAYRGGWRLAPGDAVEVPVVAGGERLALRLALRLEGRGAAVEVRRGGRVLERFAGRRFGHWQEVELGPYPWPAAGADGDRTLVLAVPPARSGGRSAVVLDRVEIDWSPPEEGPPPEEAEG